MGLLRLCQGRSALLLLLFCLNLLTTLPAALQVKEGCSRTTLADTAHLKELAMYKRSEQGPVTNHVRFCKFKRSCCSDTTLRAMRGEFVLGDYSYAAMEFMQERARKNPEELFLLLMKAISLRAPGLFESLEKNGAELHRIEEVMKTLDEGAKPMEDAFYTLWSAHLGYVTGLMCSLCEIDTSHFLKINNQHAELLLQPSTCDDLSGKFMAFIDSIPAFFHDPHVKPAIENLAKDFKLYAPVEMFIAFVTRENMRTAICGGVDKCREFICDKTYKGLGMDAKPFFGNLVAFIQHECQKMLTCNNAMINETITTLKHIGDAPLNTDGMGVTNTYDRRGYDTLKAGCHSGLSEHACHKADVDKDTSPQTKKSGSGFGTFILVVFILGAVAGGGFYVYKKKMSQNEPLNLYSSLS